MKRVKNMKKLIAAVTAALLISCSSISLISLPVNAAVIENEVEPCYSYTNSVSSSLSISGTTATMTSKVSGKSSATKIYITQYLQKKSGSSWTQVGAGHTGVYYSTSATMTNTVNSLSSGTYRVKTVAKVFNGNAYEIVTHYSNSTTC